MEHSDSALALRDWILFRNQNHHYKLKVSRVLNLWPDPRKTLLKPILKHLSTKSTSNAWLEVMVIYWDLLPYLTEPITTADGTYSDWVLIQRSTRCCVYSARLDDKKVIVKAYPSVERDAYSPYEDRISQALSDESYAVPHRYQSFHTVHCLCIPMQKLDTTLQAMYMSDPVGIGLTNIKSMLRRFIPIIEVLHKTYKRCYVDFSCGNVAVHDNDFYMIDFGALHPTYSGAGTPCMKTVRYASINATNGLSVTYIDDLQSLGFVITEALYGITYDLDKPLVIEHALEGKLGQFLQGYYSALTTENPYASLLALC